MNRDDAMVFLRAGLIVLLLLASMAAFAADRPEKPSAVFCYFARMHRAQFPTDRAAEDAARAQGAPEATIEKAKRCRR